MKISFAVGALTIVLAACHARPAPTNGASADACSHGMVGGVCRVSATKLLVLAETFAGQDVEVVLYYPGYGAGVLFASWEAAQSSDLASGFTFPLSPDGSSFRQLDVFDRPGYYKVVGRFERSMPIAVGDDIAAPEVVGGHFEGFSRIQRVVSLDEIVKECGGMKGCRMSYSRGVLPMPKLDSGTE
ncbi:hypothetical protein QEK82_002287 [Stenotrophomonas maltophilia]|uniref:hypothetical protein n=1 Tax=Stenotrophomonas maltophilia group sp. Smal13 TaxID=3377166 RepID=UPI001310B226|nr:hypothetical protein [Stenotrophomonas maltophilia]EKU9959758.1 hypothetical protein [Stenotrophomonas maltophilia]EKU9985473.1 hypothetical protein [Stenotrophomonas maltophilia]MBH1657748.1 hypothetical protein [Stenotrophomonas maltophilia]MBH1845291.1 hypothetical protein [Stenotrophomonas maltophilia]